MLPTTNNLIFDSPSNLIMLITIAVPVLAENLSIANGEFDHVALIKRNHWGVRFRDYQVSKPKQGDFIQHR
jgi:hypothetical protein